MPLNVAELVLRATRKARAGFAPSESRIYDDNAYLLVRDAMNELAGRAAMDSEKRPLLMRLFELTFADGVVDISAASFDGLLKSHLRYGFLYDPGDSTQSAPYQFIDNLQDLRRWQHPAFGYWGLSEQSEIVTRARNVTGESALTTLNGTGALRGIYIPDFSGDNPLPTEFDDWAVMILAKMLVAGRTPALVQK
jgi:hypothetical protein